MDKESLSVLSTCLGVSSKLFRPILVRESVILTHIFRELRQKYETALKEKMLIKLERDRAVGLLASMPAQSDQAADTNDQATQSAHQPGYRSDRTGNKKGPTQTKLQQARE